MIIVSVSFFFAARHVNINMEMKLRAIKKQ